ncbi:hypothetical protein F5B21DRAFT_87691 [Xylaria acuta]|nr:hypothetical protein F5B21DRAFT_87691 [Xylaria acuta]
MIRLTNPIERTSKARPNNMDIIKRAFMSVSNNIDMNMMLFDIASMSFRVRTRVYEMAQAYATSTGGVTAIVIFGAGRFQEWYQMKSLLAQASSMMRRGGMPPYHKGTSEDFISYPDAIQTMCTMGNPGHLSSRSACCTTSRS